MQKFFFHSSETFWPVQKLSRHELGCPCWILNLEEFLLLFFLEDFEMVDEIIIWIILFLFYCFYIIKMLREVCSDARDKCCFYFSFYFKKYSKHSLRLFKCSIKLYALDIFPVFTSKNQNSVNLTVFIIFRRVFMPLLNLSNRFYITFKSVALWKLSDMKIVPNYSF